MKTYKESIQWLRKKGIANKLFEYHRLFPNNTWGDLSISEIFTNCSRGDKVPMDRFISICLVFHNTIEGFDYWMDVNHDFFEWYIKE